MNSLVGVRHEWVKNQRWSKNTTMSMLLTILQTTHPLSTLSIILSLLFCLCLFKNTQDLGSLCLCRRQLVSAFASGSEEPGERERQREKEMAKQRGSKVIHLKLETGAGYQCFAVLEWTPAPSLLCSDNSVSLFVAFSRRGEVPVTPDHNMALKNINCSFQYLHV